MRRALVLMLVLASCAAPAGDGPTTTPTSTTAAPATTSTAPTTTTAAPTTTNPVDVAPTLPEDTVAPPITGETPADILDAILADAADRTGVAVDDLVVVRDQYMDWPDGSLGCPEEGMSYLQVITPGYWVQVDAGGELLDYRAGERGSFRLCETPSKDLPPVVVDPDV